LRWATNHGSNSTIGYDIDTYHESSIFQDSLRTPGDYSGQLVVTNPPYISSNRSKDNKDIFKQWEQNDLYKCFLATLPYSNVDEAIIIIPANFFCESNAKARKTLFSYYTMQSAEYWTVPNVFDGVAIAITVIHIKRGASLVQRFPMTLRNEDLHYEMTLLPQDGYRFGRDFFSYISVDPIEITKVDVGMDAPNTNIIVSILDGGKYGLGLHYNEGEPIYCNPKSFTTFQITLPMTLDETQQRAVVNMFNEKMNTFRMKYHSMFLGFYIEARQRILSRSFINKMITKVLADLGIY
jgi:hypothetical protein